MSEDFCVQNLDAFVPRKGVSEMIFLAVLVN